MTTETLNTRCCIAGGGPAGMVLGFLLARAGVDVTVLEKHADFLRDFRGDTIHPSTLEVMHELGLLEKFLQRPHSEVRQLEVKIGDETLQVADFSALPTHCRFIALMPQWDFLNFLAEEGKRYPKFKLVMQAEVTGLLNENGRFTGVRARTPQGEITLRADLVVAADGRASVVRQAAGFEVQDQGAPMDVLWLRLPKEAGDPGQVMGHIGAGRFFIMLDRGDYWQCAYVIPKGGMATVHANGLPAFQQSIVELAPYLRDRVAQLDDWDKIKLLTVKVDRLSQWAKPGVLCIGDAAHAMSPIGGVGINLAVQDAIASANLLAAPLAAGTPTMAQLEAVQERREFPTRATQRMQVTIQNRLITPLLASRAESVHAPTALRLLLSLSSVRRFAARAVGMGVRPEHVHTREAP
ncbi:MAG TPA: FAD-dependent oxidoreductase [Burkholderiales bacterium]|jgi:2-polyprenyl-6-methoxyphenol hydroxylase-like FAD-dependent oxidoreductase|nr:FAD-dependent oxidoreductase [Burkholderiales bacterium]